MKKHNILLFFTFISSIEENRFLISKRDLLCAGGLVTIGTLVWHYKRLNQKTSEREDASLKDLKQNQETSSDRAYESTKLRSCLRISGSTSSGNRVSFK